MYLIVVLLVRYTFGLHLMSAQKERLHPAVPEGWIADSSVATSSSSSTSRRSFLWRTSRDSVMIAASVTAIPVATASQKALAMGEGSERMVFKQAPTAPVGALLPAVQQRLLLEALREMASALATDEESKNRMQRRQQIESILLPLSDDNSFMFNGKHQDYKLLKKYSPSKVLSGGLVRASMNIYTANLSYSNTANKNNYPNDVYDVTDPTWKKAYIRAYDGLPSVDKVIAADLDLRDLYRNQIQQKLDDASAEWYNTNRDIKEFCGLLNDAAASFDLWLDRISEQDVKAALQTVLEGKEIQIYETYSAGFIPKDMPWSN
ncbi:hypothetical protein IV203_033023 [Nitzschia inconspicua]|uniref:Uncharacterized protein n=1 Tax=Nitzschia inconspicua TaxID=303405 RepID=A0A9K3PFC2_9STRA|nr:hypothetical protein IV203_033023 [Nitzschia inconspicua]